MGVEPRVVLLPCDPVGAHVCEQVEAAKGLDESIDAGTRVRGHCSPVCEPVGRVGRGNRVVLPRQIAVLCVAAVAEVGPQPVQRPRVGRQELAVGLAPRICVPELRAEKQPAKRLDAARINPGRVLRWAGQKRFLELACVVQRALVGVQLRARRQGQQRGGGSRLRNAVFHGRGEGRVLPMLGTGMGKKKRRRRRHDRELQASK